jgi:hypothetical protein
MNLGQNMARVESQLAPRVVQVLAQGSGSSVDWLCEKFGLDLSLVSQLGARPPARRPKPRRPDRRPD